MPFIVLSIQQLFMNFAMLIGVFLRSPYIILRQSIIALVLCCARNFGYERDVLVKPAFRSVVPHVLILNACFACILKNSWSPDHDHNHIDPTDFNI